MKKQKELDPIFLLDFVHMLEDPRIDRTKKHSLESIVIISICAVASGAKSWVEIEDYGNSKFALVSKILELKNGIPSHDTFRRFFMILNPNYLLEIFTTWASSLTEALDRKQICIDGKTLRGSHYGSGKGAIHMINAWCTGAGISIGQMKSDSKKNEIKTVQKLLDHLDIKDTVVTADAMNCQVKTAEKIVEKGADYLLCVKDNQSSLLEKIEAKFNESRLPGRKSFLVKTHVDVEEKKKHGRLEKRSIRVISEQEGKCLGVNPLEKWPVLKSIIEVCSERVNAKTGEVQEAKRYYISSLDGEASSFAQSIRNHWQVENNLHWVLDVVFREDDCRCRAEYSAENFAVIRQFALNLLKKEPTKMSINRKQKMSGWDNKFLLQVITGRNLDA
jgi:predicted transposase YbfD/YdcC